MKAFGAYHCPGDARSRQPTRTTWAWDSYWRANGMNGERTTKDAYYFEPLVKLTSVPEPAESIIFAEGADSRHYNVGTWWWDVMEEAPIQSDPVACFHGNVSSFSMADGHAEMHRWLSPNTIKSGTSAAKGITLKGVLLRSEAEPATTPLVEQARWEMGRRESCQRVNGACVFTERLKSGWWRRWIPV
jgi:prepilin-type processing-associated H-X9-DG protein